MAGGGCDEPSTSAPTRTVTPKHESPSAIPATPVRGTLHGEPFVARDGRYRIDRRPGYERLDLLLSDAEAGLPCGELRPEAPRRIWLRRPGAEPPETKPIRIRPTPDRGWQAHYQLRRDDRWVGVGDGSALLALNAPDGGTTLRGSLSVCFADETSSCAAGSFVAHYCPAELDRPVRGVEPTERPEALAGSESNAVAPAGSTNP